MKKITYLLIAFPIILLLVGCENTANVPASKNSPKIVSFLSDYIEAHPNWNQNDIIKERFNDSLKIILSKKLIEAELLDSLPLELSEVNEYTSGKYAVNFQHWSGTKIYEKNGRKFQLNFNVIGLIDSSLVDSIQNGAKYYIKGDFIGFCGPEIYSFTKKRMWTYSVEIEDAITRYEISLGTMLFDIKDMILIRKKWQPTLTD